MTDRPTTADELRRAFVDFFTERGHAHVPSASVIPVDPTLLFTIAGMVPFKPYFTGQETPPYRRAVSVQKCIRAGGKHNDLEEIGLTNRHFSFFEMLGNWSFGDYFKHEAIAWAWEFYANVLQLDTARLWVTVHVDDDEAERIWRDEIGFPAERIQRLGEANFWRMGDTGPCGPSSEIFWDLGPEFGPDGGPITEADRYIEIWNLVFMVYDQQADGTLAPLPMQCVDTGAGLERNLMVVQGKTSIWDIDAFQPLLAQAQRVTGTQYGRDERTDVSLRIIAEHARTMTFMVADGVRPSNQERGYVLRRIIRRAIRHAYLLGARDVVMPAMVDAVIATMSTAYPEIEASHAIVRKIVEREEESFRGTLQRGVDMLSEIVDRDDVSGDDAFFLHDTLGFPIDLTREIAGERGRAVDVEGFEVRMQEQRVRARAAAQEAGAAKGAPLDVFREIVDMYGPTEFTGRQEYTSKGSVIALLVSGERLGQASEGIEVDVVLDRTPFYAESGGQIGDTGTITTAPGAVVDILDTQYGLPGQITLHRGRVRTGVVAEGDEARAEIDAVRRDRIRRNHTATHVLHWALRNVLGTHVQQAGSYVGPDRLRFDFSHHEPVSAEELAQVERIANAQVISDAPVRHYETTKAEAERIGAIAFFGEKYGDIVRVLEAGPSTELCGGTHVHALGFIGPIKVVSESSIGSNLRRIEAMTGDGAFEYIEYEEQLLRRAGDLLRAAPKEVPDKIERLAEENRALKDEVRGLRAKAAASAAGDLAARATGGIVVERIDGYGSAELKQLAQETVRSLGRGVVALVGAADGKAAIAVAVSKEIVADGGSADAIAKPAVAKLGGGVGRGADAVVGGGQNVAGIEDALAVARELAAPWGS
jgi:alanyl-tRNA synthetase